MSLLNAIWQEIKAVFSFFTYDPCPKEDAGYTCHHRIMSNGTKECGEERNYWQGDDELR